MRLVGPIFRSSVLGCAVAASFASPDAKRTGRRPKAQSRTPRPVQTVVVRPLGGRERHRAVDRPRAQRLARRDVSGGAKAHAGGLPHGNRSRSRRRAAAVTRPLSRPPPRCRTKCRPTLHKWLSTLDTRRTTSVTRQLPINSGSVASWRTARRGRSYASTRTMPFPGPRSCARGSRR